MKRFVKKRKKKSGPFGLIQKGLILLVYLKSTPNFYRV